MMEFYCGLHLATNAQRGWIEKKVTVHGEIASIRCGDPYVSSVTNDKNWYWAWRFAAELPEDALGDEREVLCASLSELFRQPAAGRRPRELLYRAWHRFEVDGELLRQFLWTDKGGMPLEGEALVARGRKVVLPDAAAVVCEFRRDFDRRVVQRHPVALQLVTEEKLVECAILTWQQAAVLPREGRNFVQCPPGENPSPRELTYTMGSHEGGSHDVRPPHKVRFAAPFLMLTTAVTRQQFALFDAGYESVEKESLDKYANDAQCAAIKVSWYDAWCFARWVGAQLPTEAQWEFACRAGSGKRYCRIDDPEARRGYRDIETDDELRLIAHFGKGWSEGKTVPVRSSQFRPNVWGLSQMLGNAWEWCGDWYDAEWYHKWVERYGENAGPADSGPAAGFARVVRGGAFGSDAFSCRCAWGRGLNPIHRLRNVSFRLCLGCSPDGTVGRDHRGTGSPAEKTG